MAPKSARDGEKSPLPDNHDIADIYRVHDPDPGP
jgi:hypothetical protein